METTTTDRVLEAWRRRMPDVTPDEVAALAPLLRLRDDPLGRMVLAYRAGRGAGRRGAGDA